MSSTVDQRVVEMRFDNSHFEKNVSTTMSTLEKLKQKLNLSGASKGLDNINASAKKVNMTGLGSAVDTVSAKFSALQVMGVTALANITNSAVNAGKNIVKSLTIDPIKSGFSEYETKMGSIQTILANTEHQGTTLDDVTAALETLNLYADKTIYNFQEMTRNIGTFTAAGVDLDTSVKSIQGIANLAAVSGSTSQQASTAMYQLSQALATGTVKLMDWNSVVNAGMGGKVFQNALIRTAAMLDGAAADVEAWQAKNIDAYGSFRDSLTQGEWLTSEVLTRTLEQFTMAAEEGSAEWEAFKKSLMESGYTDKQAEEILKMANTATDAATKVKTFTQLLDTLKESAQSGWAQTWELLVGDFEEAKEFFTGLSDLFGGIIGDSANRRNNFLGEVLGSNWDRFVGKINEAGVEVSKFEESLEKVVGETKFDNLVKEFGSIEKAAKAGKFSSEDLKKALSSLGTETKKVLNFSDIAEKVKGNKFLYSMGGLGRVSDEVKRIQEALNSLGYDISPDGKFGSATYQAVMAFQRAAGIRIDGIVGEETIEALEKATAKTEEITGNVDGLSESCDELVDSLTVKSGRELLLDSVMNVIKAIHRPLAAVGEAFRNTFSIAPEQLYNALESIEKFTSKFVMGGILDITEWHELERVLENLGISRPEFLSRLSETLEKNGVSVESLTKQYGSLKEAFNEGAISIDVIKEALLSFDGISESMLLGGKNADKVRRAFEGLFAAIEIVTTIAGGGLKTAFKVLSAVLGTFDMDILDLLANMGDGLVAFRDWIFEGNLIAKMFDNLLAKLPDLVANIQKWFDAFKETPAVQKLVTAIEAIQSAFDKLMSGEINVTEFANKLGTNLANAVKALPEIAIQIASDFIAGFVNGITSGASGIISKVINFCTEFVSAFAAALGVQSPSWKAYDIAVDFFQGFINGIKAMFSSVTKVLKAVGTKIVDIFKDLWDSITDESGNIQWGKIVAGGIIASVLWILKQFATAFSGIAEAFDGIGDIFENVGRSIKSFSKVLNAYAWDLKAKALQKLAVSIAILVASVWVLAQVKDTGKLWNAVGIIAALAVIVVGLAFAMNLFSKASVSIDKNGANIDGLKTGLMQIGIVIALLAVAVKMIGSMDADEAKQGFLGLAGIALGLIAFMAAMAGISMFAKDVDKMGNFLTKIAIAMTLLVVVVKMVDGLSVKEMLAGIAFAAAFTLFVWALVAVTKSAGNNIDKVGGMIIKLSIAMGLMVAVVKLASLLSVGEMLKGAAFAAGFTLFVAALVRSTKIGTTQQLAKLGGLLLSVSISMVLMIGVCKLISTLSLGEIVKGVAFVAGFVLLVKALINVLKVGPEQQMAQVGATILALSVAIGLMAGVAVLLGMVDIVSLTKGLAAVGLLSLMMANMAKSLKGAQNAKGAIMMMAICIGVMAAAIVALSFIKPEDLIPATAALSILMGMFALMVKAGTKAKISIGATATMLGVVLALAGILALLSYLEVGSTLEVAASIGLLMLTLGATMRIIGKAGAGASAAIGPMFALTGVLALVAVILGVMSLLDINPSIETAASLSILLLSLAGVTAILTAVGAGAPAALGGIAAFAIVVAGVGALMLALAGLNALFPDLQSWLDTGITLLEQIGVGIGKFVGGLIGGIGEGMMDSLLEMVNTFGTIVEKLVDVSATGADINVDGFTGVEKLLGILGSIGLTTVGTTLSDIFTLGGTSMEKFQKDGVAFFTAMKDIASASTGITMDEAAIDSVIQIAQKLSDLQSSLDPIGGVISWFDGRDDLGTFGTNVGEFITSMTTALGSLNGFSVNSEALGSIVAAAQDLAGIQSSLEPIGGVISWFSGRDDLATFGTNVGTFIEAMKTALGSLTGFSANTEALGPIITAAQDLAGLQAALEPIGGVISWFKGRDDLATFGTNVGTFISSMKTALSSLEGTTLDKTALESVVSAVKELSELQSQLDPMGGVISWFSGRSDLGTFGTNVGLFAAAMGALKTGMGETGISETVVGTITNAGNAIIELQKALPEEGWFDGKMNLSDFSAYVTEFGTAMATFATSVGDVDPMTIDTSISAANQIKTLIETLAGLDASGLSSFAGVGFGDGHLVNLGQAIGKYGEEVANINVSAVNTSVNAATRLKTLINELSGIDASGISKFKISTIGSAIKSYSNEVASINTSVISTSVSVATRLKNFISGLTGLDTSGLTNFKPQSIGTAILSYSNAVSGVDTGAVSASITAATRIKSFINSLGSFDSSGISSFKSAINELATVDISSVISAFNGASGQMLAAGVNLINSVATGMQSRRAAVQSAATSAVTSAVNAVNSQKAKFQSAGRDMISRFANGLNAGKNNASSAGSSVSSNAVQGLRSNYAGANSAGAYLGEGFVLGIHSKLGDAYDAGYLLGQYGLLGLKDKLKEASPSKEGIKSGEFLGEGLVIGMNNTGASVYGAGESMGNEALYGLSKGISDVSSVIESGIDTQPTIRPVLDLSDVRSGASAIGGLLGSDSTLGVMTNAGAISTMMSRRSQNGAESEVVAAIDKLRKDLGNVGNTTYTIGGITYDDGSNVSNAVRALVREARIERRR